jgi:hypothetical protein
MSDTFLEPFRLSRELEKVFELYAAFERRTEQGLEAEDPFLGRLFPGKSDFEQVLSIPADDALRLPLLRHVAELIRRRVQLPWTYRIGQAIYGEKRKIETPIRGELTLAELRKNALSAGERRRVWIDVRNGISAELAPLYVEYWHREPEILRRRGAPEVQAEPWNSTDELIVLARGAVSGTQLALRELGWLDEVKFQEQLLEGASEGWPAHLNVPVLVGLLGQKDWFRDVQLRSIQVPDRLNPASFLLGLEEFGRALGVGLARRDLPFVVRRSPLDERPRSLGVVLALVAASSSFQARRLGLGRERAARAERLLVGSLMHELRQRAFQLVLTRALREGKSALSEESPWLCQAFGADEGKRDQLLGRVVNTRPSGIDFFAFAEASSFVLHMRDEFDVDWFDNPNALEAVRAYAEAPPPGVTAVQSLSGLDRWVSEALALL